MYQEGQNVIQADYIKPTQTELWKTLKFTTPKIYTLNLTASNFHTVQDSRNMFWNVICAEPILPDDWNLEHIEHVRPGEPVKLKISVAPVKVLPTRPTLKINRLVGRPMSDDDLQLTTTTIPFHIAFNDLGEGTNCIEIPEECVEEYIFEKMGIVEIASLPSGFISDDMELIVATITLDEATSPGGIHGISVQFINGISKIWENHEDNQNILENVTLLNVDDGEWITETLPKWQYHWVNEYLQIFKKYDFLSFA